MQPLRISLIRLLLVLIPISGCNRRIVDLEKVNTSSGLKVYADSSSYAKLQTSVRENSKTLMVQSDEYDAEIIPDGAFNFNAKTGFTGKAKSVKLRGKALMDLNQTAEKISEKDSSSAKKTSAGGELNQSSNQVKKKTTATNAWGWVLMACFALVLLSSGVLNTDKFLKIWRRFTLKEIPETK